MSKKLVAYFSASGVTADVAKKLAQAAEAYVGHVFHGCEQQRALA